MVRQSVDFCQDFDESFSAKFGILSLTKSRGRDEAERYGISYWDLCNDHRFSGVHSTVWEMI